MKAAAVRQIVPVLVQELGEEAALEAVRRHPELLTSHSTNFARAMPSMMQALGKVRMSPSSRVACLTRRCCIGVKFWIQDGSILGDKLPL